MSGPRYSQAGLQALKHGQQVTLTPGGVRGVVPREGEAAYRAGDRIVPARQAERLLEAVEGLPPRHDCPEMPPGIFRRLLMCNRHPRWHVLRIGDRWEVYPPAGSSRAVPWYGFTSHAAAIWYATKRARAEQLAAIQDGGAGR